MLSKKTRCALENPVKPLGKKAIYIIIFLDLIRLWD